MIRGVVIGAILATVIGQSAMAVEDAPENRNAFAKFCERVVSGMDKAALELANIQFHIGLNIARAKSDALGRLPLPGRERIEDWMYDTGNNRITNDLGNMMMNPRAFFGDDMSKQIFNFLSIRQNLIALPLMGTADRPANLLLDTIRDARPVQELIKKHFPNFGGDEHLWAFEVPGTITLFSQDKNFPESYRRGTIVVMDGSYPVKAFVVITAE